MPHTADKMGLIHKPGVGPNNRFGFKNVGNNKANELEETKEAPPGTYFTKAGNLVKGRLTKAAKAKGARETDPKDKPKNMVLIILLIFILFSDSSNAFLATNLILSANDMSFDISFKIFTISLLVLPAKLTIAFNFSV